MPDVWLIRHAPAAGNLSGTFMGQLDPEPAVEGLRAAAALARTVPVARVLSSPLRRAARTAAAIFPRHVIAVDPRLAERHLGAWQGRSKDEVRGERPEAFTAAGTLDLRVTPPDGEPFDALCDRVRGVLTDLAAGPEAEAIAVVAHNGVLRTARVLLGLLDVETASATPERFAEPALVRVDTAALASRR